MKENHFDDSHVFSAKQGLNLAVGVYNPYAPSTYQSLDLTYGRVRFTKWKKFESDAGGSKLIITEIPSHTCSSEELGLSGHDHKFFSIVEY